MTTINVLDTWGTRPEPVGTGRFGVFYQRQNGVQLVDLGWVIMVEIDPVTTKVIDTIVGKQPSIDLTYDNREFAEIMLRKILFHLEDCEVDYHPEVREVFE